MSTVLSNNVPARRGRKFRLQNFASMKLSREPIVMVTAYDSTSAKLAEMAGMEVILVGDSVAMVCLGHTTTLPVTLDEMLHHAKAVSRAATSPFLIGDLPFLSYHGTPEEAVMAAGRFLKEAGMDAVKLEGGSERLPAIEAIIKAGIPVMGHLGLTPQKIRQFGGFKPQARTAEAAQMLLADAKALESVGVFSLVLESVPAEVAQVVTDTLSIPTIGIGAGNWCDGQVLVWHDLLGLDDDFVPPFAKAYRSVGRTIVEGLREFETEVKNRVFPGPEQTRHMEVDELVEFREAVKSC
jgi:3-methyl-2-oxobutanoate hydroxymethyltransferase